MLPDTLLFPSGPKPQVAINICTNRPWAMRALEAGLVSPEPSKIWSSASCFLCFRWPSTSAPSSRGRCARWRRASCRDPCSCTARLGPSTGAASWCDFGLVLGVFLVYKALTAALPVVQPSFVQAVEHAILGRRSDAAWYASPARVWPPADQRSSPVAVTPPLFLTSIGHGRSERQGRRSCSRGPCSSSARSQMCAFL